MPRLALLVATLLVVPVFAGCTEEAPASTRLDSGTAGPMDRVPPPPAAPRGTSERWHFHDHWKGNPTIVLAEANVTLEPRLTDEGQPVYGHLLALPRGTIVPPETGFLTITVSWESPEPGPVNLTYRAADANEFAPFLNLLNGEPAVLFTTESMCDVPHRQESRWLFNLSAPAFFDIENLGAPQLPPRELSVRIEATIGRPLFIDPPHLDWWVGGNVVPLVTAATGEFVSLATPADKNVTLVGGVPPALPEGSPSLRMVQDNLTIAVDEGRIVPEKATSIVVLLNWTSDVPGAKLKVRYAEGNYPTAGPMDLVQDGASSRIFVLAVEPAMTDTTYSNRTTWEFHVLPDERDAFQGTFTMFAWATRHAPAEAVRFTLGG